MRTLTPSPSGFDTLMLRFSSAARYRADSLIAFCALTVAAYLVMKVAVFVLVRYLPAVRPAGYIACVAIAVLAFSVKTVDQPKAFRILFRGIVLLFTLYTATAAPPFVLADLSWPTGVELGALRWVAVAFGVAALWRPSFGFFLLLYVQWQKTTLGNALGIGLSVTDYMPVMEFGFLLCWAAVLYQVGRRRFGLWSNAGEDTLHPIEGVILTAVAVHFANYFYSGVMKVIIGESPVQWVFENPTYYLTLAAWEVGALPLTILGETLTGRLYDLFVATVVPLNALTLILQLVSIVALARIRWIILLTAAYDVTHIIIFLTSGIFFYKWIILNLLIALALLVIVRKTMSLQFRLWIGGVMMAAPFMFFVAVLGWLDTPSFNDEHVVAIADDGTQYRVPYNYFLAGSVTHAQQRFVREKPGHFLTDAYGSLYYKVRKSFEASQRCALPLGPESGIRDAADKAQVDRRLRGHHRYAMTRIDEDGRFQYDYYPHHIFTMPWEFQQFKELDKRKITAYVYTVESKCLSRKPGAGSSRPENTLLLKGVYVIQLR